MGTRTLLIVIGLVAGLGLALTAATLFEHSDTTASAPSQAELLQLRQDVQLLRGQVGAMRANQLAPRASAVPSQPVQANAPDDAEQPPRRAAAEDAEAVAQRREQRIEQLQQTVESEPVDATWRSETEALIASTMDSDKFSGSSIVDAECKSTVCKVSLEHQDDDALDAFAQQAVLTAPFNTHGVTFIVSDEDPITTVTYVARAGHKLP